MRCALTTIPRGEQAEQGVSHGPFGLIKGRQVDGGDLRYGLSLGGQGRRGHRLAETSFGCGQFVQARGDQLGRHVEDFAASAIRLDAGR
jgi:hypothetical protein